MKLKIVWVRFGVRSGILGGGAVRKREFTKRLKDKAEVFLVTHELSYYWYRRIGVKAEPLYLVKATWAWRQNMISAFYSALMVFLRRFKNNFHIVAARSHYLHDLLPAIWIKLTTKAKMAVYIQSRVLPDPKSRNLINGLAVFVDHLISVILMRRFADVIFTLNRYDEMLLEKLGVSPERICLINHGVDMEKIDKVPRPEGEAYDVVYFGRLSRSKGIYDLLEAWKYVLEAKPDVKLLIFGPGTGEDRRKVLNYAKKLGINNGIILKGFLTEEEKYKSLKASKIYVNPSYVDTWGISVAEAIASKVTVITYELPTYKTVYGDLIVMAKLSDKKDLAAKILQLLMNEKLRLTKIEKAFEKIKEYSWDDAINKEIKMLINCTRKSQIST